MGRGEMDSGEVCLELRWSVFRAGARVDCHLGEETCWRWLFCGRSHFHHCQIPCDDSVRWVYALVVGRSRGCVVDVESFEEGFTSVLNLAYCRDASYRTFS